MPLPDPKSHRISLNDAAEQTRRHREGQHKGGYFHRRELDELLAQAGCVGVRYYYGRKAEGQETLILVGVDKEGNDLTQGVVMEDGFWCPPFCGTTNILNS